MKSLKFLSARLGLFWSEGAAKFPSGLSTEIPNATIYPGEGGWEKLTPLFNASGFELFKSSVW